SQKGARLALGEASARRIGGETQILDGSWPIGARFEVMRELRRDVARALGAERLQTLADAHVQTRLACGSQPVVEHVAVQAVDELIAGRHPAVGELLKARRADQVGSTREVVADVLHGIRLGVPERLRQLIEAQVDSLLPEEQRALEVASVAGAEFSAGVTAAAAELELEEQLSAPIL